MVILAFDAFYPHNSSATVLNLFYYFWLIFIVLRLIPSVYFIILFVTFYITINIRVVQFASLTVWFLLFMHLFLSISSIPIDLHNLITSWLIFIGLLSLILWLLSFTRLSCFISNHFYTFFSSFLSLIPTPIITFAISIHFG